ncbi:hypothetical protein CLV98_10776 [Dyadobacter jejuensis]|uniref:Uncharacterized protein n=1 Tax=Dyadobacter jejuensis TaxID=1082580 RepID=A0A316AJF6_9BACT|nr:hypothetical protein [Dyadobacter jejuensis]PWJ57369.1 hypothetical protein CLV98_10776 [Dyadobacter jejuensis]
MTTTTAIRILMLILTLLLVFHFAIITHYVPYDIAWGGRLTTDQEMYVFESISILANLFLPITLAVKGRYLSWTWSSTFVNVVLWIFFLLFILNTIGNLLAKSTFERVFSVLTAVMSVLIRTILRPRKG